MKRKSALSRVFDEKQKIGKGKLIYKIAITFSLLFILAIALQTYFIVSEHAHDMINYEVKERIHISKLTASHIRSTGLNASPDEISDILKKSFYYKDLIYFRIVNPEGKIYISSNKSEVGKSVQNVPSDTTLILGDIYNGRDVKIIITPIDKGYTLWLAFSLMGIEETIDKMVWNNIIITIIMITATVLTAFVIANSIAKPINELIKGTEELRKGNLDYRINIKTKDEIGLLAGRFNKMADDLKKSMNELEEYSRNLEGKVKERTRELDRKVKELNDAKTATLNLLEDIDEARLELEKAYNELKESDRLKDEFMNIAAHELKTPLVPIIGYINMLKDGSLGELTPEEKDSVEIISRNIERLKKLIEDILDISKLESGVMKFDMREIQIAEVIKNSVQDMQSLADKKGLKLKMEIQDNLPLIKGDKVRLTQVLTDLIDNAIKFTEKGEIVVIAKKKGKDVWVCVKDTGIGIAKENIPKLFTKFYQVDSSLSRRYGGTGLGLAICKKIIEAHGGEIWVESKKGKGSIFQFTIPALD